MTQDDNCPNCSNGHVTSAEGTVTGYICPTCKGTTKRTVILCKDCKHVDRVHLMPVVGLNPSLRSLEEPIKCNRIIVKNEETLSVVTGAKITLIKNQPSCQYERTLGSCQDAKFFEKEVFCKDCLHVDNTSMNATLVAVEATTKCNRIIMENEKVIGVVTGNKIPVELFVKQPSCLYERTLGSCQDAKFFESNP